MDNNLQAFYRRCFLLACCAGIPFASANPILTESELFREFPIVLSATRLTRPLMETPASISVIGHRLIEASGASTVPEVLISVPGFQVASANSNEITTSYPGYSDQQARRMQVPVDGRAVYNPGVGGMVWNALPSTPDDTERIEVIRGPNAAACGANAFLGTIDSLASKKILAFEAGHFGTFLDDCLRLNLKLFRNELSEFINSEGKLTGFKPDTQAYVNKQDPRFHGAELEANNRPLSDMHFRRAYSYTEASGPSHLYVPEKIEGVEHVPQHALPALAYFPLPGRFTGSAVFYHTSKMVWRGEGDEVPGSYCLDLVTDKTLRVGSSCPLLSNENPEFRQENLS